MAIEFYDVDGQKLSTDFDDNGTSESLDIPVFATGSTDIDAIRTAALAYLPAAFGSRTLRGVKFDEESTGRDGSHKLVARYEFIPQEDEEDEGEVPPPVELGYDLEIRPATKHITHSLETISSKYYTAAGTAPNFNKGINIDEDGVPQGVDLSNVSDAATTFSIQQEFLTSSLTNAFYQTLENKVGKTNSGSFRGRSAGEVLFLGVRGSIRYANVKQVLNYEFAVSKNATGLTVGPFTGIDKKGWEYLWIYSARHEASGGAIRALACYVERVFEETNFSGMGVTP